jgi:hypothetical protein
VKFECFFTPGAVVRILHSFRGRCARASSSSSSSVTRDERTDASTMTSRGVVRKTSNFFLIDRYIPRVDVRDARFFSID